MNKKLICSAVGAALLVGATSASGYFRRSSEVAVAPYVVKDSNRTTVVTVIMSDNSGPNKAAEELHLQYWTKSTTAANTAACDPSSVTVPVTDNDIVTFDTAGILGYPLFGDTTNPAPLGMSISYAAPRHGYLVVEAPSFNNGSNTINGAYWLELDLANGGAHGDMAVIADFDMWLLWGGSNSNNATPVNFWPSSVASTAFTVTPYNDNMHTTDNSQVVMQVFNQTPVQGAYDRNENGVDGTVPVTVRCVGRVTPAQLMPGVVANAAWAAQGGWGYLWNLGNGDQNQEDYNIDRPAWVYQIDTSSAGGKFLSNATRITTFQ